MKTIFEKEFEHLENNEWTTYRGVIFIKELKVLFAKNNAKREILKEIMKLKITDDITIGRQSNNKVLEKAKQIIKRLL